VAGVREGPTCRKAETIPGLSKSRLSRVEPSSENGELQSAERLGEPRLVGRWAPTCQPGLQADTPMTRDRAAWVNLCSLTPRSSSWRSPGELQRPTDKRHWTTMLKPADCLGGWGARGTHQSQVSYDPRIFKEPFVSGRAELRELGA
jgi:hypothetical protein